MPLSLDPQIEAALALLPPDPPPLPAGDWAQRRQRFDASAAALNARLPLPVDVDVATRHATAPDGTEIDLRIYSRRDRRSAGTVVYLHGGGHFCCSIDASDPHCRRYASESGATIVSVDYRFAPEHPYPTAIEDAYAGLTWAADRVAELGGDPARLAVMGDSAGAGMAAGLALMARERNGPAIARQVLIYPMLDDRTTNPDPEITAFLAWSYDDNATGWQALLGERAGTDDAPAYAAPARANDLRGLPPAYIEVGQLDIFRDEDVAYATRLSTAGVEVELHIHPGAPHDFEFIAPDADVTRRAFADRSRVLTDL
jgi:acetyl esterase/lipase